MLTSRENFRLLISLHIKRKFHLYLLNSFKRNVLLPLHVISIPMGNFMLQIFLPKENFKIISLEKISPLYLFSRPRENSIYLFSKSRGNYSISLRYIKGKFHLLYHFSISRENVILYSTLSTSKGIFTLYNFKIFTLYNFS